MHIHRIALASFWCSEDTFKLAYIVLYFPSVTQNTLYNYFAWIKESHWHMHVCFHTSLTHTCDHVPPASMWIWPAAYVCVSMRVTANCMCMHMLIWECVCHRRWYGRMCRLCTSVLQGKMYWESKSVEGMGSHASIFLNSQDPPEYSPLPICSSIQTDVWAGIARKKHHTIIYWEYNIGWKSNELLPEGCLGYAGSLWHMKENTVYMCYTIMFILSTLKMPGLF